MYYRVTTFSFDVSRREDFLKLGDSLRNDMKAIVGLEMVHDCEIGEGQGMVIARYDSEASALAAQSQIQSLFGKMAEFMTGSPDTKAGNVIWQM